MGRTTSIVALGCLLLVGCAGEPHVARTEADAATVSEQVSAARVTLAELEAHRYASGVPMPIARAQQWLVDLEQRVADDEADDEVAWLTVQVLRAQLSAVKSYYVRREAEAALEGARRQYEERKSGLDALEEENLRLLESTGELP
jgi:PBP1b-binding outer membrane lipoprotein LpoB